MRLRQRLLRLERSGRRRHFAIAPVVDGSAPGRGERPGPAEDAAAAVIRRARSRPGLPELASFEGGRLIEAALPLAGLPTPDGVSPHREGAS